MLQFEYKVFRSRISWNGGEYRLSLLNGKDPKTDWVDADILGKEGWDFVSFVPDGEVYIRDTFDSIELQFIRIALFKRVIQGREQKPSIFAGLALDPGSGVSRA